ncbi:MAG: hypothetical protein ACRDRL_31805 [Sciscionella sp.]
MTDVRWRGVSHEQLYNWINSGEGSRASTPQLDYWNRLGGSLADGHHNLTGRLSKLNVDWRGGAGSGAQDAINPLQRWADDVQGHVRSMGRVAQNQADLIAGARAQMPEPQPMQAPQPSGWVGPSDGGMPHGRGRGPAAMVAKQGADLEVQEAKAAESRERAIEVMRNYEQGSEANRNGLGVFEEPGRVAIEVPAPKGSTASVGYRPVSSQPLPGEPGTIASGEAPGAPGRPVGGPAVAPGEPGAPASLGAGSVLGGRQGPQPGGRSFLPGEGGFRPTVPEVPSVPGALSGTVVGAGSVGGGALLGSAGSGGGGSGKGRHAAPDDPDQLDHGQDHHDSADDDQGADGGQGVHHGLDLGYGAGGQHQPGHQQLPVDSGAASQPPQGQLNQQPVQPAAHTGASVADPGQAGQYGQGSQGQPQYGSQAPVQPQQAPAGHTAAASAQNQNALFGNGNQGAAPAGAPMGTGGAGGGMPGGQEVVRGQSPLMRGSSAGYQGFSGQGGLGGFQGTHASGASGYSAASPGGSAPAPADTSGAPATSVGGSAGDYGQRQDAAPVDAEFGDGGFAHRVSDEDSLWGDDRMVAPPVLGEDPQR